MKTIGAPAIYRDGSKAVFTVLSIDPGEDSKLYYNYVSQIWMTATDGGIPTPRTK